MRARRIRHSSNAAPGIRKPMLAGSGTTPDVLNVRLSKAKTVPPRPNPTMFGFSVPPDAEKSTSVTGPKLKVTSSFVVVLRVKFAVPTVVIPDFAVTETASPSKKAAAKYALSNVKGVGELKLAGRPKPLSPTFGELVRAVP